MPVSLLLFAATFLLAGLVKGITGMGLPTVAMGLLGTAMPPSAAAAMLIIPSFITNVWQWLSGPSKARVLQRFGWMMLGVMLSTIAGAALLVQLEPSWSRLGLGVLLMIYVAYALASPHFDIPCHLEPWLSPVVGLFTGFITGATGVFVMPAVPYLQALRMEKEELIQALGLSFSVSTVALALGLVIHGSFMMDQWGLSTMAVIPALAGMWIGQKVRQRISPKRFRQCFLLFLGLLGLELAWQPFA